MLTGRFAQACALAADLHADQRRKGASIPYMAHLLAVCSLVLEHGGDEDQAIAALLHDAVEDQGGLATLQRISEAFGPKVAALVMACTDAAPEAGAPKAPWRARKTAFLERLGSATPDAALVVACDKLHNLCCLVDDLQRDGPATLDRFTHPAELDGYFGGVLEALRPLESRLPLRQLEAVYQQFQSLTAAVELPPGRADA